jgi:hypothetical protein
MRTVSGSIPDTGVNLRASAALRETLVLRESVEYRVGVHDPTGTDRQIMGYGSRGKTGQTPAINLAWAAWTVTRGGLEREQPRSKSWRT